jgi:hypothetical protein
LQADTAGTAPVFRRDSHAERHADVPREDNIYDLVERAALRSEVPRLEFWQAAAKAILKEELPAQNLAEIIDPRIWPTMTYGNWFIGFYNAVDRGNDPNSFQKFLKHIIVRTSDFKRWLNKTASSRRGPQTGITGLAASDRKLYPKIKILLKNGDATSPFNAAKKLVLAGKVAGGGSDDSKAKRLATRYLRENRYRWNFLKPFSMTAPNALR